MRLYFPIIVLLSLMTLSAFISTPSTLSTPRPAGYEYINQYKELAIAEMHRTGIPASITLAQGMHESNYGGSSLATQAHNHFGIKCKSYWRGQTYYHKDDDYDKKGKLLESCFRAYNDAVESYIDHSNFLKFSANYTWMFKLDKTNYKAWAFGLKNSGYATDPKYAEKLIKIISTYQLHKFDQITVESLNNY